jgi:multidrug resistance efflux pump
MRRVAVLLVTVALSTISASAPRVATERFSGQLVPAQSRFLSAPVVSGMARMTLTYIVEGGRLVKKGDRVLTFDSTSLDGRLTELAAESAALRKERERVAVQAAQSERTHELLVAERSAAVRKAERRAAVPAAALSKQEWQRYQMELRLARNEYTAAVTTARWTRKAFRLEAEIVRRKRERVETQRRKLRAEKASLIVRAPHDGLTIVLADMNGKTYMAGDEVFTSQRLLEIPSSVELVARLAVPERRFPHIAVGQTATVRLESEARSEIAGTVTYVAPSLRSQSRTQPLMVVDVTVSFRNGLPPTWKAGATVSGWLQ